MNPNEKKLHEIIHVGGREFRIYIERNELGDELPNYPDFQATPAYTDEGWPFARSIASTGCEHWKPDDLDSTSGGDCGDCGWLYLESDNDLIGLCMCEALRRG